MEVINVVSTSQSSNMIDTPRCHRGQRKQFQACVTGDASFDPCLRIRVEVDRELCTSAHEVHLGRMIGRTSVGTTFIPSRMPQPHRPHSCQARQKREMTAAAPVDD